MFKEGTNPPRFPPLSQQRSQNLQHYSMFLRAGLGLDPAAARTVEHCAHLAVPWGHCQAPAPFAKQENV